MLITMATTEHQAYGLADLLLYVKANFMLSNKRHTGCDASWQLAELSGIIFGGDFPGEISIFWGTNVRVKS